MCSTGRARQRSTHSSNNGPRTDDALDYRHSAFSPRIGDTAPSWHVSGSESADQHSIYRKDASESRLLEHDMDLLRGVQTIESSDYNQKLKAGSYERWLRCLLLLVALVAFGCFYTAYYLHHLSVPGYHRRSVVPTHHPSPKLGAPDPVRSAVHRYISFDRQTHYFSSLDDSHSEDLSASLQGSQTQAWPGDKYLSYLPHSGFHNQRIALENALVLAVLLNRTLLVPPVYLTLGSKLPLRYVASEKLRRFVALSGKEGLWHCAWVVEHRAELTGVPEECREYAQWTWIGWEWLVDDALRCLQQEYPAVRFLPRWDLSDAFLTSHLNLSRSETYTITDTSAYDFRLVDTPSHSHEQPSKFITLLQISELANETADARLLQLGTLFGSSRLRLRTPATKALRSRVRAAMAFHNPDLVAMADAIKGQLYAGSLGRKGDSPLVQDGSFYWGAHVRVGDGVFREDAAQRTRDILKELVHRVDAHAQSSTSVVTDNGTVLDASDQERGVCPSVIEPALLGKLCASSYRAPLYISTDATGRQRSLALQPFHETFPNIFYLSDFLPSNSPPSADSKTKNWSEALHRTYADFALLRNAYDGLPLLPFLLPFVEALVVAGAREVVGTPGSTFSAFVEDVLWREDKGIEIASRG